jgi:uncharacterized membrane protein
MSRRRSTPWIHRWSRFLIGGIATLGATNTGYIAATKLFGGETACPTSGCQQVLNSPYATVFGQPLALFGFLAYVAMAIFALGPLLINRDQQKALRKSLEDKTWLLLFLGATAMMIFSGYLMFIMFTEFVIPHGIQAVCVYCIVSALFATALFVLSILGRAWDDIGQLLFGGMIAATITLVATLSIFATVVPSGPVAGAYNITDATGKVFFSVKDPSGKAEIELAKHLKSVNAKMYGVYWCPHCFQQKEAFGAQAVAEMPYIECAAEGKKPQVEACQAALETAQKSLGEKVKVGYPTWEINGKYFTGEQPLLELARASGYKGPQNFKATTP